MKLHEKLKKVTHRLFVGLSEPEFFFPHWFGFRSCW